MKNKKSLRNSLVAVGLIACMCVGALGISAYFTATDVEDNTFAIQKVDIDLTEPNYPGDDQPITPNMTIQKDPTVQNKGTVDQYVFLKVVVPYKNIITANTDGTRNAAADTELFTTNEGANKGTINTAAGSGIGAVDSAWVKVGEGQKDADGAGTVTYYYAYGSAQEMTALAPDAYAPALFDSVTMCNAIEGQGLETTTVQIDIDALAIQAADLGTSGAGTKVPADVLAIYLNQNA